MTIRGIINVPAKRERLAFVTPEKVCPFMVSNLPWSDSTGSGREADRCRDWPQQLAVTLNPLHICTHTFTLPHFLSIVLHMLHPSVEGWRAKIAEDWMNKIPWNELAPPANCYGRHWGAVLSFCCWVSMFSVCVQVYCSYFLPYFADWRLCNGLGTSPMLLCDRINFSVLTLFSLSFEYGS